MAARDVPSAIFTKPSESLTACKRTWHIAVFLAYSDGTATTPGILFRHDATQILVANRLHWSSRRKPLIKRFEVLVNHAVAQLLRVLQGGPAEQIQ